MRGFFLTPGERLARAARGLCLVYDDLCFGPFCPFTRARVAMFPQFANTNPLCTQWDEIKGLMSLLSDRARPALFWGFFFSFLVGF
jgi:hypothetical protein